MLKLYECSCSHLFNLLILSILRMGTSHHSKHYKPLTGIGKNLKEAHMQHHFHNENYNWGITNLLADYILKTFKTSNEIPKSPTIKTIAGFTKDLHH